MGLRSCGADHPVSLLTAGKVSDPFFSVILPTYGRGRHITPSIESVLAQTFGNFELIVVGDGCADETESIVRSFPAERVSWRNLPRNSGSQSSPNNEGTGASRGSWIAYIGHDDIWAPHHLERIHRTLSASEAPDFVVSGCVFHGPKGSDDYFITGFFEGSEAPFRHFCPPTSICHRRDVTLRMGDWRDPRTVKSPADNEFLLRAAHAGMRFASTGEITVHKFAAGHRYLSYLRPGSDEQRELLHELTHPPDLDIDGIIRKSKANGQFMIFVYGDYSSHPEGFLFEQNLKRKGITRPILQSLHKRVVIEQTDEPRGLDWHDVEFNDTRYRWSGPNPKPRILIPYTGLRAHIEIQVIDKNPAVHARDLSLSVEDRQVPSWIRTRRRGRFDLVADIPLHQDDYTVLTLNAPTFRRKDIGQSEDERKLGLAVGRIALQPLEPRPRWWPQWRRSSASLKGIFK